MTTTTKTPVETYKAARADGKDEQQACLVAMKAHGLKVAQAAEISWAVETGKPMPAWAYGDGKPENVDGFIKNDFGHARASGGTED